MTTKTNEREKYKEFIGDALLYTFLRLWCYNNNVTRKEAVRLNRYFNTNSFFAHVAKEIKLCPELNLALTAEKIFANELEIFAYKYYCKNDFEDAYIWFEKTIIPFIKKQTIINYYTN